MKKIKKIIMLLPFGKAIWLILCISKNIIKSAKTSSDREVGFFGWDMYTPHTPPWLANDKISNDFNATHKEFINLVSSDKFILSQFSGSDSNENEYVLNSLKWRFYNVFWSINFAINSTKIKKKKFVECGVCDGATIFYAINSSVCENILDHEFYLYDLWAGMDEDHLNESEKKLLGEYSYLNIETTKSNLKKYKEITIFNQGALPENFKNANNPENLIWLHIDLNSSEPTLSVLEYFYDKLELGGVILLDDYGWKAHRQTKEVTDEFFRTKNGINFPLPTGQSIFFKQS